MATQTADQIIADILGDQAPKTYTKQDYIDLYRPGAGFSKQQLDIPFLYKYGIEAPEEIYRNFLGKEVTPPNSSYSIGGGMDQFWDRVMKGEFMVLADERSRATSLPFHQQSAKALAQQEALKAAMPAARSYAGGIPEITAAYGSARSALEAERDPLTQRYNDLINSIKNRETVATQRQTRTTRNELGRRGLTMSSGLAEQELANALLPIGAEYGALESEAAYNREKALRDLANQITSTYTEETAAKRDVRNAIAQLLAGAAQSGITQGSQDYQNMIQNKLAFSQEDRLKAAAELDRKLKELQIEQAQNPTPEYTLKEFNDNLYSFDPTSNTLTQLLAAMGGNTGSTGSSTGWSNTSPGSSAVSKYYDYSNAISKYYN